MRPARSPRARLGRGRLPAGEAPLPHPVGLPRGAAGRADRARFPRCRGRRAASDGSCRPSSAAPALCGRQAETRLERRRGGRPSPRPRGRRLRAPRPARARAPSISYPLLRTGLGIPRPVTGAPTDRPSFWSRPGRDEAPSQAARRGGAVRVRVDGEASSRGRAVTSCAASHGRRRGTDRGRLRCSKMADHIRSINQRNCEVSGVWVGRCRTGSLLACPAGARGRAAFHQLRHGPADEASPISALVVERAHRRGTERLRYAGQTTSSRERVGKARPTRRRHRRGPAGSRRRRDMTGGAPRFATAAGAVFSDERRARDGGST